MRVGLRLRSGSSCSRRRLGGLVFWLSRIAFPVVLRRRSARLGNTLFAFSLLIARLGLFTDFEEVLIQRRRLRRGGLVFWLSRIAFPPVLRRRSALFGNNNLFQNRTIEEVSRHSSDHKPNQQPAHNAQDKLQAAIGIRWRQRRRREIWR